MNIAMIEFMREHPLITGLLFGVLTFVLGLVWKLRAAEKKMPREKKLELNMHRAAMALRKLERAKRILNRFIAVQGVVPGQPMPGMIRRLWKASKDADNAKSHLSDVIKKVAGLGGSIKVMQNLNNYINMAEGIHEDCRQQVRLKGNEADEIALLTREQVNQIVHKCQQDIDQAKAIVDKWLREVKQAELEIAQTADPVILRSGGILRNPFKPESIVEAGQTESVFYLRQTKDDINRVIQCIHTLQETIEALTSIGSYDYQGLVGVIGRVLDSIDAALGDAELPLPSGLVSGVSPYDSPGEQKPLGALERIYSRLVAVEASFIHSWGLEGPL